VHADLTTSLFTGTIGANLYYADRPKNETRDKNKFRIFESQCQFSEKFLELNAEKDVAI